MYEAPSEFFVAVVGGLCVHVDSLCIVIRVAHLVCVPVGGQVAEVDYPHIGALALDFLCIPQREGVVVAVCEYYGVLVERVEVVHAQVACQVASGAVMVVPCLRHHLQRHGYADEHGHGCGGLCRCGLSVCVACGLVCIVVACGCFRLRQRCLGHVVDGWHAHSYPYRECVERSCECIVAFTRLSRRLVEVEDDGYACHDEQERHYPELFYAAAAVGASCQRLP